MTLSKKLNQMFHCFSRFRLNNSIFSPLSDEKPELEAWSYLTMEKVLPMLEDIKTQYTISISGISSGPELQAPHKFTSILATSTLKAVNEINLHDVWCAASVLHPGLSSFSIFNGSCGKDSNICCAISVQRMRSESQTVDSPTDAACPSQINHHITPVG